MPLNLRFVNLLLKPPVMTGCQAFVIRGLCAKRYRCIFPKGQLGVISEYGPGSLTLALQWYVNVCFWCLPWNFLTSLKSLQSKKWFAVISAPPLFVTPQPYRTVDVCKNQCYQLYTANLWSFHDSYFIYHTLISFIAKTLYCFHSKRRNLPFGEEKKKRDSIKT